MSEANPEAKAGGGAKRDGFEFRGLLALYGLFSVEFRRRRGLLLLAVAGMLLSIATALLVPWPIAWILDYILEGEPLPELLAPLERWAQGDPVRLLGPAALSVVALALLDACASYMHRYFVEVASHTLATDIRDRVFQQMQCLSLSFRESWHSGDVALRMTSDIDDLKRMLVDIPLKWLDYGTTVVAITAILAWNDWRLAALGWGMAPLLYFFTLRFGKGVNKAAKTKKQKESEVASLVAENVASMALVQAYGREDSERRRFDRENTAARVAEARAIQLSKAFKRVADILIAAATAGVLYFAGLLALEGALSVGILVVFYRYLKKLYRPVEKLALSLVDMAKLQVSARRIGQLLDRDLVFEDTRGAREAPRLSGRVEMRAVSFAYPRGGEVLRKVSFAAEPGETVAIVGPSGAGKSTLISLLLRFYDPQQGEVLFDGIDARELTLGSLRRQIAVLFQQPVLLRRSVRANIAFGRPEASEAEVERAARLAQAHEFIQALPQGYDTLVEAEGGSLSGGQRQRISIARAILLDTPIVILDEPSLGLDAEAEAKVAEALRGLVVGRTTFVIAHRFSTLRDASFVVMLEPGGEAAVGTHAELLASHPGYQRLDELQRDDEPGLRSAAGDASLAVGGA